MRLPLALVFAFLISGTRGTPNILPTFQNTQEVQNVLGSLKEDFPLFETIATIRASEGNLPITYKINDADSFFGIDETTGDIFLKNIWDFDELDFGSWRYNLIITATDSEGDTKAVQIACVLVNVDDNPPEYVEKQKSVPLPEDSPIDTYVMPINVTDKDVTIPPLLTVECVNSVAEEEALPPGSRTCDYFQVNLYNRSNSYWNGYLTLKQTLDFEQKESFTVNLRSKDASHETIVGYQIRVIDVNDAPPRWVYAESISIREGEDVDTYITYVSAVDTDRTKPRPIRYELIGTPEAEEKFEVTNVTGQITNKVVLDVDAEDALQAYTLVFKAMEVLSSNPETLGDDATTTATTTIVITVADINDNCPEFLESEYDLDVRENTVEDEIILEVQVADNDKLFEFRQFTVAMQGGQGAFKLDETQKSNSAIIFLQVNDASLLDFESGRRTFNLIITATDNGRSPSDCTGSTVVSVTVTDVNDVQPQFDDDTETATIYEDAVGGSPVITLQANDPETGLFGEDGFVYSITRFDSNIELFEIDPQTGAVTVKSCPTPGVATCLDYEDKRDHSLTVRVQDNLGNPPSQRSDIVLTISVLDRNDNPPLWDIPDYIGYIQEGTRDPNLTVRATDRDTVGQITYSLLPSVDANLWFIDPVSGVLRAINNIFVNNTRGGLGEFVFTAQASDGVNIEATSTITIYVIDTINEPPQFTDLRRTVSISENTTGGTCFTEMTVTDADSPTSANGQVGISIASGTFGNFVPGPTTRVGVGWVAPICTFSEAVLDYDQRSRYVLILHARDQGSDTKTGTSTLTVNILDINNKDPYFDPPTQSAEVLENVAIGSFVTEVIAVDRDRDKQLVITFDQPIKARNAAGVLITNSNLYEDLFLISPNGIVRTNRQLDRDIVSSMEITLKVVDERATPHQTGTGSLYIRILEVNDQAPQFALPYYVFRVNEEIPPNSFIGSLLASDQDDQIKLYELTDNPQDLFTINGQTGVLTVRGRLDYESRHNVTLVAQAWDTGTPTLSNTTIVFIDIVNLNDNAPEFSEFFYELDLQEHSTRTDPVGSVTATDIDEGDYGVVRFMTDDQYFRVDEITGEIYLKPGADLDRESLPTYTFQVTAYDSPLDASVRLRTTAPVYVILGDINDNCPVFTQGSSYYGRIIETADPDDQVLEMFANDLDEGFNHTIRFTIDPDSAQPPEALDLFKIVSIQSDYVESGRILVRKNVRGKGGTYRFTVVASDQDGENLTGDMCVTEANVTIDVQEAINDAPIWILPPTRDFSIDVLEEQYRGMLVYDCKAIDTNSGREGIVDYYFKVDQSLQSSTGKFRINRVTCVISAEVVYDREDVSSYVLTLVAKDQGDPSASSETVLIVKILDVNDNAPRFPMRNGETIPIPFSLPEGADPEEVGVFGTLHATDIDSGHENNKIYYRVVASNDNGMFELGRETGQLRLRDGARLDAEETEVYYLDCLAYNEVNDDTVIRNRRKRSKNPSMVTVIITVRDENDTPPKFDSSQYYGCVPRDAAFGQNILQVTATDQDVVPALEMTYSKVSESTGAGNYFTVDEHLGIVRNARLLQGIDSRVPVLRIRANDDGAQGYTADATVQIFVTDTDDEVKLVVNQPSADVRYYKDQLIRAMINTSTSHPIHHVCIREIRDHIGDDGGYSYTKSDVFLSAVRLDGNAYMFYSSAQLQSTLNSQLGSFESLHITSVEVDSDDDDLSLTEDPVLAIFIIALLLLILAIILFILACCLIKNSKKKKMKKLRAEEHRSVTTVMQQPAPVLVGTSVNPVYDNKGYVETEDYAVVQKRSSPPVQAVVPPEGYVETDEYAVVQKRSSPPVQAVAPPIMPVMVAAEDVDPTPEIAVQEQEPEPELTIVTHPIMAEEEPQQMEPVPDDFFSPEPEVVVPPPSEQDPVIDTVIVTEVDSDLDDFQFSEAPRVQTSMDDEIDVEFGDLGDSPSPPRSPSPQQEEFRIETNIM